MMRLLLALIGLAVVVAPASAQKVRGARNLVVTRSVCEAGYPCKVWLKWDYPSNFDPSRDTANVTWVRGTIQLKYSIAKGRADSLTRTSLATGAPTSGNVTLCYHRHLKNTACNSPRAWTIQGAVLDTLGDPTVTVVTHKSRGDSIYTVWTVAAAKADSVFVSSTLASGAGEATTVISRYFGSSKTDSTLHVVPPEKYINGYMIPSAKKGTVLKTGPEVMWEYLAPPDTTIAQINILPDSVALAQGGTQQFCPFIYFRTGRVALPAAYKSLMICADFMVSLIANGREPATAAEQAAADHLCISWSATGGTITASTCSGVPS